MENNNFKDLNEKFETSLQDFSETFKNLNVDIELFKTDNGHLIIEHFLSHYTGISMFLFKNNTFVPTVYPYIELSFRKDFDMKKVFTVIAQDIQDFD